MFSADLVDTWFDCCKHGGRRHYNGTFVDADDLFGLYPELANVRDYHGRTAVFYCIQEYEFMDSLDVSQLNIIANNNGSVLDYIVWNAQFNIHVFNRLVNLGARFNPDPESLNMTLDILFNRYSVYFIVRCVIDRLIPLDVHYDNMPLLWHIIFKTESSEHVQSLIDFGANPHEAIEGQSMLVRLCHANSDSLRRHKRTLIYNGAIMPISLLREQADYNRVQYNCMLEPDLVYILDVLYSLM
jgi:hypothetical protein